MSLFEIMKVPCCMMVQKEFQDGSGGHLIEWREGEAFEAAITAITATEDQRAEALHAENRYTITTTDHVLRHKDIFKRLSDGQIFRVTSDNDPETPTCATFYFMQREAEKGELSSDEEISDIE